MQQRTNPGFLASEMFSRVVYGAHPASRISITAESLDKMTRAMLVDFHHDALRARSRGARHRRRHLDGRGAQAGRREAGAAGRSAARRRRRPSIRRRRAPRKSTSSRGRTPCRPISSSARRRSAARSRLRRAQVMNQVIGGGPTGRLFIILREEKGYTYGAYSNVSAAPVPRRLAGVDRSADRSHRAGVARSDGGDRAACATNPSRRRSSTTRSAAWSASFALSLETPQAVLELPRHALALQAARRLLGQAIPSASRPSRRRRCRRPRRNISIRRGCRSSRSATAKIGEVLKQFGTVETYDTEGKIVREVKTSGFFLLRNAPKRNPRSNMTRFGILGSGVVGQTLAAGLVKHGLRGPHRHPYPRQAERLHSQDGIAEGAFADVAAWAEGLVLAVAGRVALDALDQAGRANLAGKLVIDVTNPIRLGAARGRRAPLLHRTERVADGAAAGRVSRREIREGVQ